MIFVKMSHLSPREIAAQALCLLAQPEGRPQLNTAGRTEEDNDDDRVITHVRPAPHRHHPYRRPGEQFDAATVTLARRDVAARLARLLGGRDQWNVFPLDDHEAQPDSEVPSVRRVVRGGDGVAVAEKVPLPLPTPRPSSGRAPGPVRRIRPSVPLHGPPPAQQPATAPRKSLPDKQPARRKPLPAQQPAVAPRKPLSDKKPAEAFRKSLSGQQPAAGKLPPAKQPAVAPREPPSLSDKKPAVAPPTAGSRRWADKSRAFAAMQIAYPLDTYTYRSLVLQALLAAPEGGWRRSSQITEYLTGKYPTLRGGESYFTDMVGSTLRDLHARTKLVEKTRLPSLKIRNLWRLLPEARDEASTIASTEK